MTALPPVSAVPPEVRREGGTETYRSALAFEGMLLDRLSEHLVTVESPFAGEIEAAFGQSLLNGGGLGLADELYRALKVGGA